jgi:hypothetical protein
MRHVDGISHMVLIVCLWCNLDVEGSDLVKRKNDIIIRSSAAEYLTYVVAVGDNDDSMEMRYEDENIWLTQKMMAALYDVDVRTINEHIKKIYSDGELAEVATIRKFRIVQTEGSRKVSREIIHYNLQMIIAIGFKVNNDRAVRFRKWAGQIVKDYTIQGWTMDKKRLKKGHMFTDEYFERQLQSIREIRLSERKFYQKITDLYATAFDYDKNAKTTKRFFQTVQNKMHWAVHRHTAAELIVERANANKKHMGLTTWESAPDGNVHKESDVDVLVEFDKRPVTLLDYCGFQDELSEMLRISVDIVKYPLSLASKDSLEIDKVVSLYEQ